MKKSNYVRNSLIVIATLIIILIGVVAMQGNKINDPVVQNSQNTQAVFASGKIVNVGVTGSQYTLSPAQFKKGEKVSLVFDMNEVTGCARSVVIKDFGIRQMVSGANNIIEFTPDKTGTFVIACSMNMYRGSFDVIN